MASMTLLDRVVSGTTSALGLFKEPTSFWGTLTDQQRAASVSDQQLPNQIAGLDCWWPSGPVEDYWEGALRPVVLERIDSCGKKIRGSHYWDGPIDCFMSGSTRTEVEPTVFVAGQKVVFNRLKKILSKCDAFKDSGFGLLRNPGTIVFTAGQDITSTELLRSSASGGRVESIKRRATLGAVIKIGDKHYGLTAAHPFIDTTRNSTRDSEPESGDEDDDDYSSTDASINSNDESPEDNSHHNQTTSTPLTFRKAYGRLDQHAADGGSEWMAALSSSMEELASLEQHNFDLDMDWALLSMTRQVDNPSINEYRVDDAVHVIEDVHDAKATDLMILASEAEGFPEVSFRGPTSLISPPGSSRFVNVTPVVLLRDERKMRHGSTISISARGGESGALIVNPENGCAYGMVIAKSHDQSINYMTPLRGIFESIARKMEAAPEFPSNYVQASDLMPPPSFPSHYKPRVGSDSGFGIASSVVSAEGSWIAASQRVAPQSVPRATTITIEDDLHSPNALVCPIWAHDPMNADPACRNHEQDSIFRLKLGTLGRTHGYDVSSLPRSYGSGLSIREAYNQLYLSMFPMDTPPVSPFARDRLEVMAQRAQERLRDSTKYEAVHHEIQGLKASFEQFSEEFRASQAQECLRDSAKDEGVRLDLQRISATFGDSYKHFRDEIQELEGEL